MSQPVAAPRPGPPASAAALLKGPILPTLARLAAPNALAMVATALVAIAETAYVGRMGVAALAGVALVFPLLMLMQMMSAGAMGGGVSAAIARANGAGDAERVEGLALCALVIGAVAGAIGVVLFLLFGPVIFRGLGGEGAALDQAVAYSQTIAFAVLMIWLSNSMASILRGVGRMTGPAAVIFLACALQIVVGGALGLGLGPFPQLGVVGVGLGQLIAFTVATTALFILLRRQGEGVRLRFTRAALQPRLFSDILRVGGVACLSPIFSVSAMLIITGLVARFGTEALAGYGIGARLEFLLIPIAFSIGVASVPMVGVAVGAGAIERARRVAWIAGGSAAVLLGVIGLVVLIWPDTWARLFTSNEGALDAAALYLRFAGLGFPFFGLGLCLYFASQGAGKILGPIGAQFARLVVVGVGAMVLAGTGAPLWSVFLLVALSMLALGLGSALVVRMTPWGAPATPSPARA
ncbi:MAG: MATE family efflux transporter [Alphaproteobacteria bacterium]|nr:MATE family efflux transporter [Alphaproteobacteria bacterium]